MRHFRFQRKRYAFCERQETHHWKRKSVERDPGHGYEGPEPSGRIAVAVGNEGVANCLDSGESRHRHLQRNCRNRLETSLSPVYCLRH